MHHPLYIYVHAPSAGDGVTSVSRMKVSGIMALFIALERRGVGAVVRECSNMDLRIPTFLPVQQPPTVRYPGILHFPDLVLKCI